MAISAASINALGVAMAGQASAQEVGVALNKADALSASLLCVAGLIVATNVSQTIDFGSLKKGDHVLHTLVADGTSVWLTTIATAGTLGVAAVVGDNYLVLRSVTFPAAAAALPSF